MATGEGWEYRHRGFVHLRANLHSVGDWGRSGAVKPGRADPADEDGVRGVGATTAVGGGNGVAGCDTGTGAGVGVGMASATGCSIVW